MRSSKQRHAARRREIAIQLRREAAQPPHERPLRIQPAARTTPIRLTCGRCQLRRKGVEPFVVFGGTKRAATVRVCPSCRNRLRHEAEALAAVG